VTAVHALVRVQVEKNEVAPSIEIAAEIKDVLIKKYTVAAAVSGNTCCKMLFVPDARSANTDDATDIEIAAAARLNSVFTKSKRILAPIMVLTMLTRPTKTAGRLPSAAMVANRNGSEAATLVRSERMWMGRYPVSTESDSISQSVAGAR
jgi:hypothetical protein